MKYSITIYGKKRCPFTINAIDLVKSNNISCEIIYVNPNVDSKSIVSQLKLKNFIPKNSTHSTVPIIFFVYQNKNIKFIGGCSELKKYLK